MVECFLTEFTIKMPLINTKMYGKIIVASSIGLLSQRLRI